MGQVELRKKKKVELHEMGGPIKSGRNTKIKFCTCKLIFLPRKEDIYISKLGLEHVLPLPVLILGLMWVR